MRIVHFSDIHLSSSNYDDFRNDFLEALISDLKSQSVNEEFELIVITGDLVDCGGDSLYQIKEYIGRESELSPFDIFKELFINPISEALNIPHCRFLFVPGNHDIDESGILLKEESTIVKQIMGGGEAIVNEMLLKNDENFHYSQRIKKFKEFEEDFHSTTGNYEYSNNQSVYIHNGKDGCKYGFILTNDSWRCKSVRLQIEEKNGFDLNLGINQLHEGLRILDLHKTDVNICLMHHPLEKFNDKDDIEGFFFRKEIDLILFGDLHTYKFVALNTGNSAYISSQCRASFNNHNEKNMDYLCGYQILELTRNSLASLTCRFYDGSPSQKRFFPDHKNGENGINKNQANGNRGFLFNRRESIVQLDKSNFIN